MAFWSILLPFLISWVTGSPLEVTSPAGINRIFLNSYGVDITQCTQLSFRMKACKNSHILLGDGTPSGSYEIIIGGWNNAKSGFRQCSQGCFETDKLFNTEGILNCNEYRDFWVSWGNDRLAFGTGNTPNAGTIFDEAEQLVHEIEVVGCMGFYDTSATIKLGEDNGSLFELVVNDAMYPVNPYLLTDVVATEVHACGRLCHEHSLCGRFTYWHETKSCKLFGRNASTMSVVGPVDGFDSWRMIYCKA